jgi:hypothetical protein
MDTYGSIALCNTRLCVQVVDKTMYKGKTVPQHTYGCAGWERIYSSYSFTTSVLDEGEWSASRPDRALSPGKDPRYRLYRRLGRPQSLSGHRLEEKSLASAGSRTSIAQSVARHCTDWTTPAPRTKCIVTNMLVLTFTRRGKYLDLEMLCLCCCCHCLCRCRCHQRCHRLPTISGNCLIDQLIGQLSGMSDSPMGADLV